MGTKKMMMIQDSRNFFLYKHTLMEEEKTIPVHSDASNFALDFLKWNKKITKEIDGVSTVWKGLAHTHWPPVKIGLYNLYIYLLYISVS